VASYVGSLQLVFQLLDAGADVNARGTVPVRYNLLARMARFLLVRRFLDAGINVSARSIVIQNCLAS
jgi:hypothetical protein